MAINYRRTKALGATYMTGGGNDFYKAIGYKPTVKWTCSITITKACRAYASKIIDAIIRMIAKITCIMVFV